MPEALTIETALTENHHAGAYLYHYYKLTADSFDFSFPFSARVQCRPKGATHPTHLESRHLEGRHLVGVGQGGHLDGIHLENEHLAFQDLVRWSGGFVYGPVEAVGTADIAVKIFDREGRASSSTPPTTTLVVNTSPTPGRGLVVTEKSGNQLTFTFTPSPGIVNQDGLAR